ncbi:ras guanine nucleotide exchange factor domain-containing protein [Catenaria anguillulae PL171]|uniref:Ras guanine nucleotide exchange factor domain-containing protein n=1 Tax=Catenaria anguillulae PL171 TaxID=765915 RepID=A0A1Y2HBF8_9FUNG|nr:ras guanine nucleotide exchange factor domain-containing protein [Catenaria anguillulae PL171]
MADLSHSIVSGIDQVADTILGYSLLSSGPALKDSFMPNGVQVHSHVATRVQEARVAGSAILQRSKIAAGVWPPPTAAPDLIASLHETGAAVRRLVADAKQAIRLVRASMAVDIAKAEEQRRLWMHGEQVRAMFQVWESSTVTVATAASTLPVDPSASQQNQVASPSESAAKAAVVLKDAGHLDDPTDGIVFENSAVRGGRLRFDEPFVRAFLMTHHSFTTSQDLMSVLIKRYELVPPLGIKDENSFRVWVECKLMPVRTRVLTIITMWVNNYFSDFLSDDKVLLVKLREFLNIKAAQDFPIKVQQINGLLTTQLAAFDSREPPIDEKQAPKPIVSKAVGKLADGFQHLLDVDSTELARQWTLIEARCFRAVSNKEWINQIWGRVHEASRTKAPTIDTMIGLTNKVTTLVSLMVVREEQEKARHVAIKYWIHVAQACAALNNYNAVTAVIAGLKMGPVRRMEKTWASFHKKHPKSSESFTKLSEAVSTSGQYANYRKLMKNVQPPCIPFLGVHITDLTFIEDGNPDYLPDESSGHLINFEKRRKVAAVIEEISQMQRACKYHLHTVPAIESFLMRLEITSTERELYAMSVKAEPIEDDSDDE